MSEPKIQTLEDLRMSADAAWLWDGMRGRLVWANTAGIAIFEGQSVFDLIDKVFDASEAGLVAIADLTKSLSLDEVKKAKLAFPSIDPSLELDCECWLHTLADGRPGLLAVSRRAGTISDAEEGFFDVLPVAALMLDGDGVILKSNQMAQAMFDIRVHQTLSAVLGNGDRSEKLLTKLRATNLVSSVEPFEGRYGHREARLNLRRMPDASTAFAIMVMDDITERRSMERQLSDQLVPSKPAQVQSAKFANQDAQAFEALARSLNEAIANSTEKSEIKNKKYQPVETVKLPIAAQPPKAIIQALEATNAALVISQQDQPVFVSQKALQLLEEDSFQSFLHNKMLCNAILQSKQSQKSIVLSLSSTKVKSFEISSNSIPWMNGPARQIVLREMRPAEQASNIKATEKTILAKEIKVTPLEVAKPVSVKVIEAPALAEPAKWEAAANAKLAEEEIKSILDIASDGIITLDKEARILSFSAGAESIFGYRSAEVKAKAFAEFFDAESRKILHQYLAGLEGPGLGAVFNDGREVTAIVKQGGTVPLFLTIGKLQNGYSEVAYGAVVRDITTWKRTEKELREAKETAETASRQKSEFLARISHELRTPLNAILGFSDVMRLSQFGDIKNEKYRGYVNDIHASGSHLLALINDLLDLSKIEAGKLELNFTAVNIADCADHAIKLLQETATRGRVLVRKSFPEKLPRVVADLRAMRQIMLNLLSNAIKFTDPGGQVIISASIAKSGELTFRLKDTGIGMNVGQIKDALEPFKRVETPGRETQGTGLGLPLTKALVEANRAKFELGSEIGQGTLIEITFPTTRVLAE